MTTSGDAADPLPTDPASTASVRSAPALTASVPTAERWPMDPVLVAAALARPASWDVRHVIATGSTNDDLARGAGLASGAEPSGASWVVLVTEQQTAGKGRSGRQWSCPAGAGLMFSIRLPLPGISDIPVARRGWIGALLGLAICRAFTDVAGVPARLKWPNDVLVNGLKCGGILAEMTSDAVIVGAGLNISLQPQELPRVDTTSLALAGATPVDRNVLLAAVLDEFAGWLLTWRQAGGNVDASGLRRHYLATCATIGASVRVELPGDRSVVGVAVDVDADGAIILQDGSGRRTRYSAGDVVHLRPAEPGSVG